jgi:hypothetical protein
MVVTVLVLALYSVLPVLVVPLASSDVSTTCSTDTGKMPVKMGSTSTVLLVVLVLYCGKYRVV